ncbi:MAG: lysine--tRNA ligase [Alphaproteobacteria bacterium]|nr:lysine--tRNA ligase [Alphaproteobacteria bacterium]
MTVVDDRALAKHARAWPFEEARRVLARYESGPPAKGHVLFETGYGPSGLPHIGTFGEVARTTMVRQAFRRLSDTPTRLIAFSDDMDGLRKVPDNVPNPEKLREHLGLPLTSVPDPFGSNESFGAANNSRLRAFLDSFGFEYEFRSATECYRSGQFDETLRKVLVHYDEVINVILPTLGPERRATYSPFLPVSPRNGKVLQVPIVARDIDAGTVSYRDPNTDRLTEVPVTGGRCKLQWKCDWAMRWVALGVDYEMSGKDLIDSVKLSSQICRILGVAPPEGFNYELFLDEKGQKISKSRGNGLAVEEWLRYAPPESLALYMYQSPRKAKRLFFDVIPRAVDDYLTFIEKYQGEEPEKRIENPVWHLHDGHPPSVSSPVSFGLLLNLASVAHAEDKDAMWGFISRYVPGASSKTEPFLDRLVGHAVAYYKDQIRPAKRYRKPSEMERAALDDLAKTLATVSVGTDAEALQNQIYEVGKRHAFADLRAFFQALYEILLGQSQGPRFGGFVALYGVRETVALIRRALAGEDLTRD